MKMKRFSDVCCSRSGRDDGTEDVGLMGRGFLCSFPVPPHTFPRQHLPQWARWARRRAGAGHWWCGCAPAALPGAAACTRSAAQGREGRPGCGGHSAHSEHGRHRMGGERRDTHLRFGINFCRMLQEEVHDFYVSVVAANVQRSVSHLERTSAVSKCE